MFHAPFRPRNPLARLIGGILGILAVAGVLALGVFALAALVIGGGLFWLFSTLRHSARRTTAAPAPAPGASAPAPGIIDGEFTVIRARPDHSTQR